MNAFAAIDLLETPLKPVLDPRVYVEPKDAKSASEEDRQGAFVACMRRLAKSCEVAANTNAAKRSRWAAAKVKREGLLTGRNDLDVKWAPRGLALIEFKDGNSMPEPAQIECLNRAISMGFPAAIIRTPEVGFNWLRSVGAPVPEVQW
jgi:hypothetical protein